MSGGEVNWDESALVDRNGVRGEKVSGLGLCEMHSFY